LSFTGNWAFVKLHNWLVINVEVIIMASKDFRHRETKKQKKDVKKVTPINFAEPVEVEVIKKGKKPREEDLQ
jgi:hypothetical protein